MTAPRNYKSEKDAKDAAQAAKDAKVAKRINPLLIAWETSWARRRVWLMRQQYEHTIQMLASPKTYSVVPTSIKVGLPA